MHCSKGAGRKVRAFIHRRIMTKLKYILTDCTDPAKNLAVEEYLTFRADSDEVTMYLWQNANTVVIGRNQNPWKECRLEEMAEGGCTLARRVSGGGAVYHDLGNLNFTFIAQEGLYDVAKQTEVILRAVQILGIHAEKNGRNDLTIDGKKFSGHAYFKRGKYCYHHGTIMMDVNRDVLSRYLNVSTAKLKSKGVDSVRSRVTNLTEFRPELTLKEVEDALIQAFGEVYQGAPVEEPLPSIEDPDVRALYDRYRSDEWRLGRRIPFDVEIDNRLDFGSITIQLHVVGGVIQEAKIYSDSLETDVFPEIEELLKGAAYKKANLSGLDLNQFETEEEQAIAAKVIEQITLQME